MSKEHLHTFYTKCIRVVGPNGEQCGTDIECTTQRGASLTKYCKLCKKIIHRDSVRKSRDTVNYRHHKQLEGQSWKTEQPVGKKSYWPSGYDRRLDSEPPPEAFEQLVKAICHEMGVSFKPMNTKIIHRACPDMVWLLK